MRYQPRPPFQHRPPRPEPESIEPEFAAEHDEQVPEEQADEAQKREAEYLRHLMDQHTPVVAHLVSGETFSGVIEYYDRRFIRLTREGGPNLFIFKKEIKYLSEA